MSTNDARDTLRAQFTISTAFCLLTAIAIMCAVARWEGAFPYWTILPAVCFAGACFAAQRGKSSDLAWGLIAMGWLITCIHWVWVLKISFEIMSGPPSTSEMQSIWLRAYGSMMALPLFLTIPSVYWAVRAGARSSSYARRWLIACAIIAFADATLATVFLMIWVEYAWLW